MWATFCSFTSGSTAGRGGGAWPCRASHFRGHPLPPHCVSSRTRELGGGEPLSSLSANSHPALLWPLAPPAKPKPAWTQAGESSARFSTWVLRGINFLQTDPEPQELAEPGESEQKRQRRSSPALSGRVEPDLVCSGRSPTPRAGLLGLPMCSAPPMRPSRWACTAPSCPCPCPRSIQRVLPDPQAPKRGGWLCAPRFICF